MSHQSSLIQTDIHAYLAQHERKDLLRFITCGSVDDGKSTLIGRLLHDSQMIYEDQLAAITRDSRKSGHAGEAVDLALLVDGLQSEREQGITIDVAYRYFSTEKRKFIIADTPGHEQYTRNMATGASTANLAVLLIDARYGVQTQTRRHSFIVDLLGIRHVIIAVNKMDLVDFSQARFDEIREDYLDFARQLDVDDIRFVPISALEGDNVVRSSTATPWYGGETLMQILETVEVTRDTNFDDFRLPVQYVNRPDPDFRGYCGTVAAGIVQRGDAVKVLPSGRTSRIERIVTYEGDIEQAFAPMSVTLTLEDEIDISRGDVIVHGDNPAEVAKALDVMLVWMSDEPMRPGTRYLFKSAAREVAGCFECIDEQIDVNTLERHAADELGLNGIARCRLALEEALVFDPYRRIRATGSFIVIDPLSNLTVGAGMIRGAVDEAGAFALPPAGTAAHSAFERELNALIRKHFPHWGLKPLP
ncbi:MAG: sulfate adenylyltransferase subunit CysN [Halothiobacillaceae bacterium]